jgi:zinc transport system substrate-binding protein
MRKFPAGLLSAVLVLTSLSGCASVKTEVAYTVYPVGYIVSRIGEGVITASSIQSDTIVQRAVISDDYQTILENSAVFLHIGSLEPYLTLYSTTIQELQPEQIDLSVLNAVYDNKRYTLVSAGDTTTFLETEYYDGDAFSSIDQDAQDLYLWMDPIAMLSMAKDFRDWVETEFPENTSLFEDNFESLEKDLIDLDAQYQSLATSIANNDQMIRFVTMSNSFGNWQKTYGFEVYPVILSKYGVLPNEEQLAIIEQRIQDDGVNYIVYEPNMTDDMIELFNRIKEDLGLTQVELSNLSSLTEDQVNSGKDYLSIMYENLSVLQTMVEDRTDTSSSVSEEETETETESLTSASSSTASASTAAAG